jgi:pyruvate-formate lyase-activating enzyme
MNTVLDLKRLVIEPTYRCNLHCTHCYIWRSAEAVGRSIDARKTLPVVFWLRILAELPGAVGIHFTGGEIFAYPDIFVLLEAAVPRPFSLVTNGVLLDLKTCTRLAELGPDHVTISLLGDQAAHDAITGRQGSFRQACASLQYLARLLPAGRLTVNTVLLPQNWSSLPAVAQIAKNLGATNMVVQLFDPTTHRCGISAGISPRPTAQPLDWSGVPRDRLQVMLESLIAVEVYSALSSTTCTGLPGFRVHLASEMAPVEILAGLDGRFDWRLWRCSEVFDSMRCSPLGEVYTCTGSKIGSLGSQPALVLWQSPAYQAFRAGRSRLLLDDSCAGCCKIRRRDDLIRD